MQSFARNVLLEAPLLRRLPKDDLLALASLARLQHYKPRDVIFHQGDPGDSFHVIVEGLVRIVITAPSGDEQTLALLGRGDCFGELAILDGQPRSASALVVESAILTRISREDLRSWLSSRPQAALALLETISLRLRRTNESLVELAFSDIQHRLARQLLRLAAEDELEDSGRSDSKPAMRLRITQADLASLLSVTRESVNKELQLFAQRGWISLSRGVIVINEPEKLRELDRAS